MKYPLDVSKPQFGISNDDIRLTMLTKYSDWQYEQERRILLPLAGQKRDGEHYFRLWNHQLQLREVLLGARCSLEAADIIPLIGSLDRPVSIRKIRPSFKRFR